MFRTKAPPPPNIPNIPIAYYQGVLSIKVKNFSPMCMWVSDLLKKKNKGAQS